MECSAVVDQEHLLCLIRGQRRRIYEWCRAEAGLSRLPLAQRELGLSWAWPWSGFIISPACSNQPGDGALSAIFSIAAAPRAKHLSTVLLS